MEPIELVSPALHVLEGAHPPPAEHPVEADKSSTAAAQSALPIHVAETQVVDKAPPPRPPVVTRPPAVVEVVPQQYLRRITSTVDPIGELASTLHVGDSFDAARIAASTRVFGGLTQIATHIGAIQKVLDQPSLPANLIGSVHQPDGGGAARVQVQFNPSAVGVKGGVVTVLTADDGGFQLALPPGSKMPVGGLDLTVHGANQQLTVTLDANHIGANGVVVIVLPTFVFPLPVSITAALKAMTSAAPVASFAAPKAPLRKKHAVTLGERGSLCSQTFAANERVDRFPWGIFFRLVEPQMTVSTQVREVPIGGRKLWLPMFNVGVPAATDVTTKLVNRVPIDQPLSVDGFRDQLAGIDASGRFSKDETVPMASSLGVGYVLRMAQHWEFQGLGLGDLIYSLPLAPGEQQQVAVFERQDTSSVTESESFSQTEAMRQNAMSDTSTNATFGQAFREMVLGSSNFSENSTSSSVGVSFGIGPLGASGGSGSSSSNGDANSSLQGSRDVTSQAAQATHSSAENTAAASLNASRVGMRLATVSENMSTTTKTITNHNHVHALTMQYWEVQRVYDVSTTIEGVTLCCLIPMQIVRFMPPGQPMALTDPSIVATSPQVTERYKNILRHLDVLQSAVPSAYRRGLDLLAQFAADPTTIVESAEATQETVIALSLQGAFLPCERIYISAVTKRNTRIGPVMLGPSSTHPPPVIPLDFFMTQDELTTWLNIQRQDTLSTLQGALAIPPSINRSDIVGFEIRREFVTLRYNLTSAARRAAEKLLKEELHEAPLIGSLGDIFKAGGTGPLPPVSLAPATLESLLGGPRLTFFRAAVETLNGQGSLAVVGMPQNSPAPQETYANDSLSGVVLPAQPYPVPALQVAPVLRYHDVLEIEKSAQHIVRNTARYSKSLWMSLTPEETAILLDGYTVGIPTGGLEDSSQMIPLLNCLQNTIIGVYGNSLIMPFIIPQELADACKIDPGKLQESLLQYQREAFVSPHSTIALPTKGVIGEAVLGSCASAEKIDLTRFWNWQDAPSDTAPGIGMVQLPTTTPPLTTGVTAPNSLTNLPPLINNLITAPQPNTALLQAMGKDAASQPDFSPEFTGQQQLAGLVQNGQSLANQARSDALKSSQAMAVAAMNQMTSLVGSAMKQAQPPSTPDPGTPATNPGTQPKKQTTDPAKSTNKNSTKTGGTKADAKQQDGTTPKTPDTSSTDAPAGGDAPSDTPAANTPAGGGMPDLSSLGSLFGGSSGSSSGLASVAAEVLPIIAAL